MYYKTRDPNEVVVRKLAEKGVKATPQEVKDILNDDRDARNDLMKVINE